MSYESFKTFKISASDFHNNSKHKRIRACADEFLATVTEGMVQGVYVAVVVVVTQSSFSVPW